MIILTFNANIVRHEHLNVREVQAEGVICSRKLSLVVLEAERKQIFKQSEYWRWCTQQSCEDSGSTPKLFLVSWKIGRSNHHFSVSRLPNVSRKHAQQGTSVAMMCLPPSASCCTLSSACSDPGWHFCHNTNLLESTADSSPEKRP